MVPEVIQLTKVGVCGCGQQVAPGERAGYSPALDQVVCLSCLKAPQGEPRRRFRVPRETFEVSAPTVAEPTAEATAPNLPPLAARLFEPPAPTTAADSAAVPDRAYRRPESTGGDTGLADRGRPGSLTTRSGTRCCAPHRS